MTTPPRPRSSSPRLLGFSLFELLIALGASALLAAGVWIVFGPTSVAADVEQTRQDFGETAQRIERGLGIVGGFSGLSNQLVLADGLAADRLRRNGSLENAWGGGVTLSAYATKNGNDSFLIETRGVPKSACSQLISALSRDPALSDVLLDGQSVFVEKRYDPAATAVACEQSSDRMGFVYYSGLVGSAVAVTPLLPPTPSSPVLEAPTPSTPSTPILSAPSVGDAPSAPSPVPVTPGPPAPVPPAVPALPPAPAIPTAPQPVPSTVPPSSPPSLSHCVVPPAESRGAACAAGTWGTRTEQRQWWCGNVGGPYEAWATAAPGTWTTTASTCRACPAGYTDRTTQWVTRSAACSAGTWGTASRQWEQARTRSVSYNCPAGTTTSPPAVYGGWSAWNDTGNAQAVNTASCQACPANRTDTELQWVTRSASCPSGTTGTASQQFEQRRSRSVTYSCPAGTTTSPGGSAGAWSGWTDTGNTRPVNTSGCSAAPSCTTSWVYTMIEAGSGGCGAQGGGSGGNVETEHTATCSAVNAGETWQSGYAERLDAKQPDCDISTYQCQQVTTCPTSCGNWIISDSTATNFSSLDGESATYDDGAGGGCSASWGIPGGDNSAAAKQAFRNCEAMIPNKPPRAGASASVSEFSTWGGIAENRRDFTAPAVCP